MRLHHLEITAFGPFADTVTVDFDTLSQAGLFLLTGPTGSGKSSVLDAVCFALYGDVPGDRAAARRLRSDQAAAGVAPRVSLDCTLAGRRFRIVRSPAWQRPKKRGSGTTLQQASVTVSERVDGTWTPLSSRLDEAGQLVSGLVGMTLSQFTQVALLPQGRFQGFLRARSDDRHRLLQQLFRTGRFDQVERWLREHRATLAAASQTAEHEIDGVLHRLLETVRAADEDPRPPEDPDDLIGWADQLVSATRAVADRSSGRVRRAAGRASVAVAAREDAQELGRRQADHRDAVRELRSLETEAPQIAAARDELDAARRAASLRPVLDLLDEAEQQAREAAATAAALTADVAAWAGADPDLPALGDRWSDRGVRVAAWQPRADQLRQLEAEAQADVLASTAFAAEGHAVQSEAEAIPARLEALAALEGVRAERERLRTLASAAAELVQVTTALAEAEDARRAAMSTLLARREEWLTIREQRITGMAAELAGGLVVGGCCPVCGSADHPHPAAPRADAPDAASEKAARRLVDDAEARLHGHDEAVRDLHTRRALAHAASQGHTGIELVGTLAEVDEREQALLRLVGHDADQGRTALTARADELAHRGRQLTAARAATEARLSACRQQIEGLRVERDELLADTGAADLDELSALASERSAAVRAALDSRQRSATADRDVTRARRRAQRDACAAGFSDRADAATALRDEAAVMVLEQRIRDHDSRVIAVRSRVDDPELAGAARQAEPDLATIQAEASQAQDRHAAALADAELAQQRATRATALAERLAGLVTAWSPLRADLDVATRLSAFVDGRSPDNALRMRLSAYVVAHRLGQVVAAANDRLSTMSNHRYSLEHTGRRGAGETRGGLSLLVRDDWSGEARDPATLSGGETFVVSLALALGLADVVIDEVGGATLDTLFVDEGFGTLDAETLDDVMDTLDALRDGGRVVGVVSHVAELRDRIPTQLAVAKARRGSSLSLSRSSS